MDEPQVHQKRVLNKKPGKAAGGLETGTPLNTYVQKNKFYAARWVGSHGACHQNELYPVEPMCQALYAEGDFRKD